MIFLTKEIAETTTPLSLFAQVQEMQKAINSKSYEEGASRAPKIASPTGLDYDALAKNPISRDALLEAKFQDQLRKTICEFVVSTLKNGKPDQAFGKMIYETWELHAKKETETLGAVLEVPEDIEKKIFKEDNEISEEIIWADWEKDLFRHTDSWLIKFPSFEVLFHRYGGDGFILRDFIGSMYSPLMETTPDLSQSRYKNCVIKKYVDEALRLHVSQHGLQFTKKAMKKFKGNRDKALAQMSIDLYRVFAHEFFMAKSEKLIFHIDACFPKGMEFTGENSKELTGDIEGLDGASRKEETWKELGDGRIRLESDISVPMTILFESKQSVSNFIRGENNCESIGLIQKKLNPNLLEETPSDSQKDTARTNMTKGDMEYFEGGGGVGHQAAKQAKSDMYDEVREALKAALKILVFCSKTEFVNKFKQEERIPDEEGGGVKRAPKLPPKKIVYLPKQFMDYHKTGEVREPSDRDITPHNRREHKRVLRHPRFGDNVGKVITVKKSRINGGEDKDREVVYKVNEKSKLLDILYGKREAITNTIKRITKKMREHFGYER